MNEKLANKDKLLKAEDVAERLSISRAFAYQLMQSGEIPTVRLNRAVRVQLIDLEEFVRQNIFRKVPDVRLPLQ